MSTTAWIVIGSVTVIAAFVALGYLWHRLRTLKAEVEARSRVAESQAHLEDLKRAAILDAEAVAHARQDLQDALEHLQSLAPLDASRIAERFRALKLLVLLPVLLSAPAHANGPLDGARDMTVDGVPGVWFPRHQAQWLLTYLEEVQPRQEALLVALRAQTRTATRSLAVCENALGESLRALSTPDFLDTPTFSLGAGCLACGGAAIAGCALSR